MAENEQPQGSEALDLLLKDLAQRMERVKNLYEQYFMGLERVEPAVARKEIARAMLTLQQTYIRNTALRFRFNTMLQKWSLYTQHWNRILREIENGTYIRHLQKAARTAVQKGKSLPQEMRTRGMTGPVAPANEFDESPATERTAVSDVIDEVDLAQISDEGDDLDALLEAALGPSSKGAPKAPHNPPSGIRPPLPPGARGRTPTPAPGIPTEVPPTPTPAGGVTIRVTPPQGVPAYEGQPSEAPPANRPTPAQGIPTRPTPAEGVRARTMTPAPTLPGVAESELRALHRSYSEAKAKAGDKTPERYETLVASLAKQVPRMLQQPGVRGVRFAVEIKDGKPVVKAIPTK